MEKIEMSNDMLLVGSDQKAIIEGLYQLLDNTQTIYTVTKNYHWNATGSIFQKHHMNFENQHEEIVSAFDLIAERIKFLGCPAPVSRILANDPNATCEMPDIIRENEMFTDLLKNQKRAIQTAHTVLLLAEKSNDKTTADLLTLRIKAHAKVVVMLSNFLGC
jgi:starvation-inducible DNA-binding protein